MSAADRQNKRRKKRHTESEFADAVLPDYALLYVLDVDAVFVHRSIAALFPEASLSDGDKFWANYCRPAFYFDVMGLFRSMRYGHYDFRVWADQRFNATQRLQLLHFYFRRLKTKFWGHVITDEIL